MLCLHFFVAQLNINAESMLQSDVPESSLVHNLIWHICIAEACLVHSSARVNVIIQQSLIQKTMITDLITASQTYSCITITRETLFQVLYK